VRAGSSNFEHLVARNYLEALATASGSKLKLFFIESVPTLEVRVRNTP
jgi:hypothetical protein